MTPLNYHLKKRKYMYIVFKKTQTFLSPLIYTDNMADAPATFPIAETSRYVLARFHAIGIDTRIDPKRGLQIKQAGLNSRGIPYNKYNTLGTATANKLLNAKTHNNIASLIETDPPPRVRKPYKAGRVYRFKYTQQDGEQLHDIITGFSDGKAILTVRLKLNNGDTEILRRANTIDQNNKKKRQYYDLRETLEAIRNSAVGDYNFKQDRNNGLFVQLIEMPRENPPLQGIKQGQMNCVIQAVLDEMEMWPDVSINICDRLLAFEEEVHDRGVNDEDIAKIAAIARLRIVVHDKLGVWREFGGNNKKKFLLKVHNNHATLLKAEELNPNAFIEREPIFYDSPSELVQIMRANPDAEALYSKDNIIAVITPTHAHKLKFHEHELFPQCFGDSGVAKEKFLKQFPIFKSNRTPPYIFETVPPDFHIRTAPSSEKNFKYDMNRAFQSYSTSPYFKGIPERFNMEYAFPQGTTIQTLPADVWQCHGLLYVRTNTEEQNARQHFHFRATGWYPVEFVQWATHCPKCDFAALHVSHISYSETTYSPSWDDAKDHDTTAFTKDQFRKLVGKAVQGHHTESWTTRDENEYLRALWTLKERVKAAHKIDSHTQPYWTVEYESDRAPWRCPSLALYIKSHYLINMYSQYNTLLDNGIIPVSVCVDSIEVSKPCDHLFNIDNNGALGTWKHERIHPQVVALSQSLMILPYVYFNTAGEPPPPCPLFRKADPLPKLLHICGSGGNGKTHWLVETLLQSIPLNDICYTATTHCAAQELIKRGLSLGVHIKATTYHRVFGIGCPGDIPHVGTFVIEECSQLSSPDLEHIDDSLRKRFDKTQPFGGRRVVLSGDFGQLANHSGQEIYNSWTKEAHPLYQLFEQKELTVNRRQQNDPEFFALCESLRGCIPKANVPGILAKLNTRVLPLPPTDTLNDLRVAGTNAECDIINEPYKALPVGCKVIANKTFKDKQGKVICNGQVGRVAMNNPMHFMVIWTEAGEDKITPDMVSVFKGGTYLKSFDPAMCLTIHKAQGQTKTGNVAIDPSRLFDRNHLYVALTRATKFENIYLTEPITEHTFSKTCMIEGISLRDYRLKRMAEKYSPEDPKMTFKHLRLLQTKQNNKCHFCGCVMFDEFGLDTSVTLDRLDNNKTHTVDNCVLSCFRCNSGRGVPPMENANGAR